MPSSLSRIAAYIDAELEQQIKAFCKEQGFSTSEAIAHILNHFFGRLPSKLLVAHPVIARLDDLTKRLEVVEQALRELRSESPSKRPEMSGELSGELLSDTLKEQEPTGELPNELPSQELTGELPSEPPLIIPDPFPEEGLSTVELADLTSVTVQQVNRIRRQGKLHSWKGGWRALKINEKEHRYYPLWQPLNLVPKNSDSEWKPRLSTN